MAKLFSIGQKIKKLHFFFASLCYFATLREFNFQLICKRYGSCLRPLSFLEKFTQRCKVPKTRKDDKKCFDSNISYVRKISILPLLFLCVILVACGSSGGSSNDLSNWVKSDGKIRVLATTSIVQDLVQRIGGDKVKVVAIINGNQDPHSYEVVKGDGEKFTYAEVVFASGLMLEHSGSMEYQLKHHKNVVYIGNEILDRYPSEIISVDGQLDPHIWMDIMLWSYSIDFVRDKLIQMDPAHEVFYREQSDAVRLEFSKLDSEITEKMHRIPENKRYLGTSHDAFNYFVRRYFATPEEVKNDSWRVRMQALQGLAPDEQISVLQIKEIVDHVCKYHINVIFPESNLSRDSLEKVKEACGKRGVYIRLASDTLYGDTLGGKTYLEMLEYDADVLESGLDGSD